MLKSLNIPLSEFLRPFFEPSETVCIRIFDDRKTGTFKGAKLETKTIEIEKLEESLHKHNKSNRGIYFVINYGGHEDKDITRINAQFMECDDIPIEEQFAQIEAFKIEPSIIVKTRKSLHTYWLMKNANVENFRRVQKRLIAQFGGDRSCINESRVLRLPGFLHCKEEPVMVECIKFNPELRYTQAELEAVLPTVPDEPVSAPASNVKGSRRGLALVSRRCDFIKHCTENAASLPEHDWYAMISNLAVFEDGDRLIHELSAKYPKYSALETQVKISHFLESGTKPMTCKTIAEKGFTCPKLGSKDCGCKSPAALCYIPLSVEDLRVFLSELPISKSAVDNVLTLQTYARDYLYNVDSTIAGAFIEHEVKDYFSLKAGDVKPLSAEQRELYKAYRANKETKRETTGDELPEWYEATDKGGLRFLPGVLADYMAKNSDVFYGAGSYYFYENGVYVMHEDIWAQNMVRQLMLVRQEKTADVVDTVNLWKMRIIKSIREINANSFIINLRNGLYNVMDGSFKPHVAKYFSTVQISAEYDIAAKCPQFLEFLGGILPETELPLVQEIFGYLLIPINKAQKSFVFVGAANAGKSTLLSVAQDVLLGADNVSNIPWQALGERFNKAELFGKLANIFADLPSKMIDDGGMFKALTGEDSINAERKNKDPFNFRPHARLLFSCNNIPKNYSDRSDGFYRRLIIIRFDKSVPPEKRNPNLKEQIACERNGILTWALEGLHRLIENDYQFSETQRTRAEVTRYRIESNSVLTFADEMCEVGDRCLIVRDELYNHYKNYCSVNGMKSQSQTNFNKELEVFLPSIHRGQDKLSGRRVWRGITYVEGGKE